MESTPSFPDHGYDPDGKQDGFELWLDPATAIPACIQRLVVIPILYEMPPQGGGSASLEVLGVATFGIAKWQRALAQNWAAVRFGELEVTTRDAQHLFELQVHIDELDPEAVRIELYADGLDGGRPECHIMKRIRRVEGAPGGYVYAGRVPTLRPAEHCTPRMIGGFAAGVAVPLEARWIAWQR